MIGVVIPEISHSFFAEIISGTESELDKSDYDVLLCHSRSDPVRERAEIEALTTGQIDGLIVAPVQPERSPSLFLELQKRGIPFVLVDRFFPSHEFPVVRLDDAKGGFLATEFLLKLGHKAVYHIAGPNISPATLRRRGFLKALRQYGITAAPKDVMIQAQFDIEDARRAMNRLLERKPRPTAVFAANDPQAIGAIYACREAGLDVPGDISIIGAGNIEGVYHPNAFLTTIDWPRQDLGREAAKLLLQQIGGKKPAANASRVFAPSLLIRHSTGPPRK
jgi:LacI family transcriptional regulator